MTRHNQCPLCHSGSINHNLSCTDHLVSGEIYELFKCETCGFIFTQDHPDEKMIGKYYDSEDYASHSETKPGLINRLYSAARKIMLHKKLEITEHTSLLKKGKILDIGCGTGYFAAEMKENGWVVTGIEPSGKAREMAIKRFGLEILEPEETSSLKGGSFDVITMWHSLEHLHDPYNYSREILRLLKPDGLLISALPNCGSYDARHFGNSWAAYDVPRHLWHFTPDTFSLFAEKAGFKITGIKPLPLDVFYISILSEKNREKRLYLPLGLIKGSFFAARAIFKPGKSSSLIYFLRKK